MTANNALQNERKKTQGQRICRIASNALLALVVFHGIHIAYGLANMNEDAITKEDMRIAIAVIVCFLSTAIWVAIGVRSSKRMEAGMAVVAIFLVGWMIWAGFVLKGHKSYSTLFWAFEILYIFSIVVTICIFGTAMDARKSNRV